MRQLILGSLLLGLLAGLFTPALAEEAKGNTVPVYVFEARLRAFSPGIEAIITLGEDQKQKLGTTYQEVFGVPSVRLASSVLQDASATMGQRQMATSVVLQAQADFRAKSRQIFTDQQRDLIDKVYALFNEIYAQAQEDVVKEIKENLAKGLDTVLTPEQKQAMAKRAAEVEAARAKAEGAKPAGTEPAKTQ